MLVIPSEARNLKISQSLCSFEMTTFFMKIEDITAHAHK